MDLDRLITETVRRQLLVENAINNSWRAARKMVIARFGYTKEEAEKVLDEICNLVGLSYEMVKFIKGCTRMFLNGEFKDQRVLGDFKDALNKIKTDGHIGEFDTDLRRFDQPANAVNSAKDIIGFFKPEIDRKRAEQRQKLSGMTFERNPDYEIVKINSFEEAREYSQYTSWCVTKDDYHYDGYTNNGINQFYFCLKKSFEKLTNNGDFNDTKDDYALSMLAILVNPEGELIHCTNRKNNDQSTLNPEEISELVGRNFYDTFKPNTIWRDALEDTKKQLDNGIPVEKVFDEVRREGDLVLVCLSTRWNILGEGNVFLCDCWYDGVWGFNEGFATVRDNSKGYNFINSEGKEICDRWYDSAWDFSEGFAAVKDDNKGWNIINREGKEVLGRWYDYVYNFHEGLAAIGDKNKGWNFINSDGEVVFGRWYDNVHSFHEGLAVIKDNNKGWNFINSDGEVVFGRWYEYVGDFHEGFAVITDKNKGWNFINRDGEVVFGRWYDWAGDFHEGLAIVKDYNKGYNFINRDGEVFFGRWYDSAGDFYEGFAGVKDYNKGWNFINREGKEIGNRWYECVYNFYKGFARVVYKGKSYQLRKDGVLCDFKTNEPIEYGPEQMAESLINRLVKGVLNENRKQYYL